MRFSPNAVDLTRSSGILLHPTSLPNGILDEHAYRFVDWLEAAGQRWWQVLPLGPPEGITGSPYMSPSAFAGSPTLLAEPSARVSRADAFAFQARTAYWIDDWIAHGGSLEDQVRFEREWQSLRSYARDRGVRLFGDIPIYVSQGGADHLAHPTYFRHGEVAGRATGRVHAHRAALGQPALRLVGASGRWLPLVDRADAPNVRARRPDAHRPLPRLRLVLGRAGAEHDSREGPLAARPRLALFEALEAALGELPVVAEDLGVITEPVVRLRRSLGLPGMVVLQFAFGDDPTNPHLPQNHHEQSVVYTGTHDNDTTRGWFDSLTPAEQAWTELDPARPAWSLMEVAWSSPARLAIAPLQDVLGLGSEARMNLPGTQEGNWRWRFKALAITADNARELNELTRRNLRT